MRVEIMPIDSEEWKKGRNISDVEKRVKKFLQSNKEKAFSSLEISDALYPSRGGGFWVEFGRGLLGSYLVDAALRTLVADGDVEVRVVGGIQYYRAA